MGMAESDPVPRMREDPKGESGGRRDHQSRLPITTTFKKRTPYSLTCSVWRSMIRPVMRSMATLTQTRLSPATLKSAVPVPGPVNFPF